MGFDDYMDNEDIFFELYGVECDRECEECPYYEECWEK